MIKSSHYNNNISNGSSLIVRVRYVYVHQNIHEKEKLHEFLILRECVQYSNGGSLVT